MDAAVWLREGPRQRCETEITSYGWDTSGNLPISPTHLAAAKLTFNQQATSVSSADSEDLVG